MGELAETHTQRPLLDLRMADGSRHFGGLPETYDAERPQWYAVRDQVARLPGAVLRGFVTDDVTEAWIDFELAGHRISINNQQGEWWFFVDDPACPDERLVQVLDCFEGLLNPAALHARRAGPLPTGSFRAIVLEADGRVSSHDFTELEPARRYADDAAWEVEDGVVIAYVVDDRLRVVHRP